MTTASEDHLDTMKRICFLIMIPPSSVNIKYKKKAPQREPFLINSIYLSDYWIPQVAG